MSVPARSVYLVSACLLGIPTAYDGEGRLERQLLDLAAQGRTIPICPESAGGLPTPRPPAEIVGGSGSDVLDGQARVVTVEGVDVTAEFVTGAKETLAMARRYGASAVVLKARSPSCGVRRIYDGSHSGELISGHGVTAALLNRSGIEVISEEDLASRIEEMLGV